MGSYFFEDVVYDPIHSEKYIGIFHAGTGVEVEYETEFVDGDRLRLLETPFDKNGYHATGWAVYDSLYPYAPWRDEYETEEGRMVL